MSILSEQTFLNELIFTLTNKHFCKPLLIEVEEPWALRPYVGILNAMSVGKIAKPDDYIVLHELLTDCPQFTRRNLDLFAPLTIFRSKLHMYTSIKIHGLYDKIWKGQSVSELYFKHEEFCNLEHPESDDEDDTDQLLNYEPKYIVERDVEATLECLIPRHIVMILEYNNKCPICFDSTMTKEDSVMISLCGHIYHQSCMKSYHYSDPNIINTYIHRCPVCRKAFSMSKHIVTYDSPALGSCVLTPCDHCNENCELVTCEGCDGNVCSECYQDEVCKHCLIQCEHCEGWDDTMWNCFKCGNSRCFGCLHPSSADGEPVCIVCLES